MSISLTKTTEEHIYNIVITKDNMLLATYRLESTADHKHRVFSEESTKKALRYMAMECPHILNVSGRELERFKDYNELEFVEKIYKHSDEICCWKAVTKRKETFLIRFFPLLLIS